VIAKLLLVLGYYLTQPLTWGVCLAASLVVAYHPNWRIGFVLVALSSYVWLMMIALVSYERGGMGIVAKSYVPVTLVASAVSLFAVRLVWKRLGWSVQAPQKADKREDSRPLRAWDSRARTPRTK
jgi:hypothetical protein